MALMNPIMMTRDWLTQLSRSSDFQQLSPEAQEAVQKSLSGDFSNGKMPQSPEFWNAVKEMSQKNLMPGIDWKKMAWAGAAMAGIVAAPYVISALGSGGAGASAGATTTTTTAADAAASGVLPSTSTIGYSSLPGAGVGIGNAGGTLASIGGAIKKGADIFGATGDALGSAANAAGNNRISKDKLQMDANKDYENALMGREQAERNERNDALKNVYRDSWYTTRQAGPNNTRGIQPMTPEYMATLGDLAKQGSDVLSKSPTYSVTSPTVDPLTKYKLTDPSTLEKIGGWGGPILSTIGKIAKIWPF